MSMQGNKLVYMVNQIARAFAAEGEDRAVAATAEHLKLFWDPRMRREILAHLAAGGEGLEPVSRAALKRLT
jgi:formate dehydrogenase subunit delta